MTHPPAGEAGGDDAGGADAGGAGGRGAGRSGEHPADHPGPLVFVADLERPAFDDRDRHHLVRVLRVRPGDPLSVADGAGRWRPCRLGGERDPEPEPTGPVVAVPPANPPITIGFAPVKGDRPELAVQKLTELGVDRIVPLVAARSVVRWDDDRVPKALARLRQVARAAAMQCHRARLPEVTAPVVPAALAAEPGAVLAERGGDPPSLARPIVLVGPEGGWDPDELGGRSRVGLGADVLRTETAAITAGVLLTALRAGLVR